ncbi:MAG: winged helix-turn-helix transcriptional regulator, partial [Dehalococcoidia bacterium]
HRFNELEHGLPRISRTLLTQRLRALEEAGIVERRAVDSSRVREYHLTPAGKELFDVVIRLGEWSHRWFNPLLDLDNLDPQLLLWDMHRRILSDRLPERRVVVQVDFHGARTARHWLLLERKQPTVCWEHPGFEIDLLVTADTLTLHRVWLGHQSMANALQRGQVALEGPPALVRAFPNWLALSMFAAIRPAAPDATRSLSGAAAGHH